MAHLLRMVCGSVTVDLTAAPYVLQSYVPQEPEEDTIEQTSPFVDGGQRAAAAYRNVSEPVSVIIMGNGTATSINTAKAAIDRMFQLARRRQKRGIGDKAYIEYQPDGYLVTYRSELIGGRAALADAATRLQWLDRNIEVVIGWTRGFCWEGAEAQVPLTNLQHGAYAFVEELSDPDSLLSGYANLTGVTAANSNAGVLYFTLVDNGFGDFDLFLYADAALSTLVGFSAAVGVGPNTITPNGGSGLGGTLTIDQAIGADSAASARWDYDRLAALTLYNHTDAGHVNYADVAAADIGGSLPAPLRLEITNTFDNVNRASHIWIAQNVLSDPANLDHILEGEDATNGGDTYTDEVDTTASSGGVYRAVSWEATTETELFHWTLSTALLNACRGNHFRILARFASTPSYTNLWIRFKVKISVTTIWTSAPLLHTAGLAMQDLGVLQLPPYLVGLSGIYPLTLTFSATRNQSGTHSLNLDYLQLSPLDGWRKLIPRGYGLELDERVVDDGIAQLTYVDGWTSAPTAKLGYYVGDGQRLSLWPNEDQRLYILHDSVSGSANADRTLAIKCYYRPRRLTI